MCKPVAMDQDELKLRPCQVCGTSFAYPLPDSLATRFHCENCSVIEPSVRKALERLNARLRKLEKDAAAKI